MRIGIDARLANCCASGDKSSVVAIGRVGVVVVVGSVVVVVFTTLLTIVVLVVVLVVLTLPSKI